MAVRLDALCCCSSCPEKAAPHLTPTLEQLARHIYDPPYQRQYGASRYCQPVSVSTLHRSCQIVCAFGQLRRAFVCQRSCTSGAGRLMSSLLLATQSCLTLWGITMAFDTQVLLGDSVWTNLCIPSYRAHSRRIRSNKRARCAWIVAVNQC